MTTTDYGPQTPQVEALVARIGTLTDDEATRLAAALDAIGDAALDAALNARNAQGAARYAAWDAALDAALNARDAVRNAARDAAQGAARYAALDDAWCAVRDASLALVVRDLIPTEYYDVLTRPWRQAIGRIHPDDPDLREDAP